MRHRISALVLCLSVGWTGVAAAQTPDWVNRLLTAAELPIVSLQARQDGVSNDELRTVLEALRTKSVPAYEARDLIDAERNARRENGPVDNFGAFVQSKLDQGLRGQALAAAIHAEHAAHGKSRGVDRGIGRPESSTDLRGRPAGAGNAPKGTPAAGNRGVGKPGAGSPGARGETRKPVTAGKPPVAAARKGNGRPAGRPDHPIR